jgi:hypothetical protein
VLVLLALAACVLTPAQANAAAPLSWSAPSAIDGSKQLSAVSCPSESLCVAVDAAGNALASADPTSPGAPWASAAIDPGQALSSVSCSSNALCVAVDGRGEAFISSQPLGGAGAWSAVSIDAGEALTGVSCPAESLCVAVDAAGNVLASSDPASPQSSWSVANIDPAGALRAVSCTPSACVAVDGAGNALASSDPTGGPGAWRRRAVDPALAITGLSCTASGGCLAVDASGNSLASSDPVALAPTWSSTAIEPGGSLASVSCASSGLCVAVGGRGEALASDDPSAPLPAWSESSADPGVPIAGISCLPGGFCAAVDNADNAGRVLTARVPAPAIATPTPSEVTATTATLSASVDPEDATLLACSFEYGTSSSYGQSAPCASLPSPAGGSQTVSAPIAGLSPNTTYHYRLLASSAAGTRLGADETFTTAVSSEVPIAFPLPSITGTPAPGELLTCRAGLASGASARLSYQWLRDLLAIPGAGGSSYLVKDTDTGHHLQCQVTASDAGGSATARSAFVTVPVEGVQASAGETVVGRAHARGARLSLAVTCSGEAVNGCRIMLRVTAVETLRAGRIVAITARAALSPRTARAGALRRVTITLGLARAHLARGQHSTVSVLLNPAGRRLLAARHRLAVALAVSGTVIGVIESTLAAQTLEMGTASHGVITHGPAHRY